MHYSLQPKRQNRVRSKGYQSSKGCLSFRAWGL